MVELREIERFTIVDRGIGIVCEDVDDTTKAGLLGERVLISGQIYRVIGIDNQQYGRKAICVIVKRSK